MRARWLVIALFFAFNTMVAAGSGKWGGTMVCAALLLLFLALGVWDSYRPPANFELAAQEDLNKESESREESEAKRSSSKSKKP